MHLYSCSWNMQIAVTEVELYTSFSTEPSIFLYVAAARQLHPPYFTVWGFLIEDLKQHIITFMGWSKGEIPSVRPGYHHRMSGVPARSLLEVFGQEVMSVFFFVCFFLRYGTVLTCEQVS